MREERAHEAWRDRVARRLQREFAGIVGEFQLRRQIGVCQSRAGIPWTEQFDDAVKDGTLARPQMHIALGRLDRGIGVPAHGLGQLHVAGGVRGVGFDDVDVEASPRCQAAGLGDAVDVAVHLQEQTAAADSAAEGVQLDQLAGYLRRGISGVDAVGGVDQYVALAGIDLADLEAARGIVERDRIDNNVAARGRDQCRVGHLEPVALNRVVLVIQEKADAGARNFDGVADAVDHLAIASEAVQAVVAFDQFALSQSYQIVGLRVVRIRGDLVAFDVEANDVLDTLPGMHRGRGTIDGHAVAAGDRAEL